MRYYVLLEMQYGGEWTIRGVTKYQEQADAWEQEKSCRRVEYHEEYF